ncbi:MAG: glycosyltransferase [Lewinellaceae bacterium]|nr:glycosyltransferase [Lewinellaceae bacterium]
MITLYYFIFGVYFLALVYITLFTLLQFNLLYYYRKFWKKGGVPQPAALRETELPFVTVQLPVYNEMYVVERLIEAITQFDYPKEKFEIHVLDDSTDETVDIVKKQVALFRKQGFQIEQIRRSDRQGFKAGALKEAMARARGEFIAIFDADFLPRPDFLRATLPYFFANPKTGVVQTRWEHINRDYSLITRLQALQLNVHFTVEQQGRQGGHLLLQFNGTAGIWRRKTIDDAGGWEADTLTEDLDLSIRAQLKGWEIVYLEKFESPAELPAEMNGLKSQQFRWMKGGAETARKMLPTLWHADIPMRKKFFGTMQLLGSAVFLFVFVAGVFSVPLVIAMPHLGIPPLAMTVFLASLLAIGGIYYVANVEAALQPESWAKKIAKFIVLFPLFLALSMGLSLHNSIAVLQGYLGKKTPFVRTPKFNIQGIRDSLKQKKYLHQKLPLTTVLEGLLALYFLWAIWLGFEMKNETFFVFHLLLVIGYGTICYYSVRHLKWKS